MNTIDGVHAAATENGASARVHDLQVNAGGGIRFKRLVYVAGPGNVIGTYVFWRQGQDDPTQISITYSSMFYDVCRELDIEAVVIAQCSPAAYYRDGNVRIYHRPVWWRGRGGLRFHLGRIGFLLSVMRSAIAFRSEAVIVCDELHLFVLAPLRLFGIKIIPSLHCALWPASHRPTSLIRRGLLKLNGWFFRHHAAATICVSPECERQVRELSSSLSGPVFQSRAQYRKLEIDRLKPPQFDGKPPFRVLFAGRIEREKGVFDLLDAAIELERRRPGLVEWQLRGTGSALDELKRAVALAGLTDIVHLGGYANRASMLEELSSAHVVIVPTTKDFAEGLNKVAVEAIVAGRPLVTTSMSNGIDVLGDTVIEVEAGSSQGYADAIERLALDREFYEARRTVSASVRHQFLDSRRSWGFAITQALQALSARQGLENPATASRAMPCIEQPTLAP